MGSFQGGSVKSDGQHSSVSPSAIPMNDQIKAMNSFGRFSFTNIPFLLERGLDEATRSISSLTESGDSEDTVRCSFPRTSAAPLEIVLTHGPLGFVSHVQRDLSLSENSFNEDDGPEIVRPVAELSTTASETEPEEQDEPEDPMEAVAAAAAAALVSANREWEGSDNEAEADQTSDDGGGDVTPRSRRGSRRATRPFIRRQSLEPAGRENADGFSIAAFWASKNGGGGEQLAAPFPGVPFYNEALPEGQGVAVDELGAIVHGPFPGIKLYTEQSNHRSRSNSLHSSTSSATLSDSDDGSDTSAMTTSDGAADPAAERRKRLERATSLSSIMDSFELVPTRERGSDKQ